MIKQANGIYFSVVLEYQSGEIPIKEMFVKKKNILLLGIFLREWTKGAMPARIVFQNLEESMKSIECVCICYKDAMKKTNVRSIFPSVPLILQIGSTYFFVQIRSYGNRNQYHTKKNDIKSISRWNNQLMDWTWDCTNESYIQTNLMCNSKIDSSYESQLITEDETQHQLQFSFQLLDNPKGVDKNYNTQHENNTTLVEEWYKNRTEDLISWELEGKPNSVPSTEASEEISKLRSEVNLSKEKINQVLDEKNHALAEISKLNAKVNSLVITLGETQEILETQKINWRNERNHWQQRFDQLEKLMINSEATNRILQEENRKGNQQIYSLCDRLQETERRLMLYESNFVYFPDAISSINQNPKSTAEIARDIEVRAQSILSVYDGTYKIEGDPFCLKFWSETSGKDGTLEKWKQKNETVERCFMILSTFRGRAEIIVSQNIDAAEYLFRQSKKQNLFVTVFKRLQSFSADSLLKIEIDLRNLSTFDWISASALPENERQDTDYIDLLCDLKMIEAIDCRQEIHVVLPSAGTNVGLEQYIISLLRQRTKTKKQNYFIPYTKKNSTFGLILSMHVNAVQFYVYDPLYCVLSEKSETSRIIDSLCREIRKEKDLSNLEFSLIILFGPKQKDQTSGALYIIAFFDWLVYQKEAFWYNLERTSRVFSRFSFPKRGLWDYCFPLFHLQTNEGQAKEYLGEIKMTQNEFVSEYRLHNHIRIILFLRKMCTHQEIIESLENI